MIYFTSKFDLNGAVRNKESAESADIANTVGLWDPIMEFRSVHCLLLIGVEEFVLAALNTTRTPL